MTGAEVIWSDTQHDLSIRHCKSPSDQVFAFLSQIVWGSRDMRYRILDIGEKLSRLRDPHTFLLELHDELVSVCILDRCKKVVLGRPVDAFHFVLAATADRHRDKGLAGILLSEIRHFCERNLQRPGLAFAYIESSTEFSLRLANRIGHTVKAEMPVVIFSRLLPMADPNVTPVDNDERAELVRRLSALYAEHEFSDFEASIQCDRMLALRKNGGICAAVQIEELRRSVVSLPGLGATVLLRVLPWLPLVGRIFDPSDLRILRISNVLVEPGEEASLAGLLSAGLARNRAAVALMIMDRRSPVLARIRANCRLGLIGGAIGGSAGLHIDFVGFDESQMKKIRARPLIMSAADVF